MDEKRTSTPVEEHPIDVQRRAIREAVQRRLRVKRVEPTSSTPHRRPRVRYSSGDLSCDLAFDPLIKIKI